MSNADIKWDKTPKEYADYLFNNLLIERFSSVSGVYPDYIETIEHCVFTVDLILANIAVLDIKSPLYEYWQNIRVELKRIEY